MLTYSTIVKQVLLSTGQGPAEDGNAEGFSVKLIIGLIHFVGSPQNTRLSDTRVKYSSTRYNMSFHTALCRDIRLLVALVAGLSEGLRILDKD